MIAVEANQKRNSATETSDDVKEGRPSLNSGPPQSSWDADAFAKRVDDANDSWKERETTKSATRVQDLSVGISSQHGEQVKQNDESWPYENSPCRMFGGKNTKKAGEEMNKELFDPDFVDHQSDDVSFSDADSFCGDGGEDEDDGDDDYDDTEADRHLPESSDKRGGASHTQMLAWNRQKQGSDYSLNDDDEDDYAEETRKKSEEHTISFPRRASRSKSAQKSLSRSSSQRGLSKSGSQRRLGMIKSNSQRALGMIKSNSQRALGMIKSKSQRALKTITPGQPGDRPHKSKKSDEKKHNNREEDDELGSSSRSNRRKSRRSNANSDLSAATMHGTDGSTATAYARGTSRRSSRAPNRVKSSDSMEVRGSSRGSRDELGAATLHGKSSISRIRKERRSSLSDASSSKPSRRGKPDRRSMMKRAMSTANVKQPEEYHGGGRGPAGVHGGAGNDLNSPGRHRSQRKRPTEPRRDIMDLLRGQKEVTEKDLANKDNRKVLSYLMLEHKLGITLGELSRTVRKETKDGIVPSPPKPELYVEAA